MTWLARRAGTSERTLARLFRTQLGVTYPQWRTSIRVFHAMIQLAEGATVTQAAHRCGWATTSAFIDTFTRTMGETPGALPIRRHSPCHSRAFPSRPGLGEISQTALLTAQQRPSSTAASHPASVRKNDYPGAE